MRAVGDIGIVFAHDHLRELGADRRAFVVEGSFGIDGNARHPFDLFGNDVLIRTVSDKTARSVGVPGRQLHLFLRPIGKIGSFGNRFLVKLPFVLAVHVGGGSVVRARRAAEHGGRGQT